MTAYPEQNLLARWIVWNECKALRIRLYYTCAILTSIEGPHG